MFITQDILRAQCRTANGEIRPSYVNILVAMDPLYVSDFFHGDFELARAQVEQEVDDALVSMSNANTLNMVNGYLNFNYNLSFKKIFFPLELAPQGNVTQGYSHWAQNVTSFYKNKYPCAKFDIIILHTGVFGTGLDHAESGVAFLGGLNSPQLIAHEVGHLIGLNHILDNSPGCCGGAYDLNPFMCEAGGGSVDLFPDCGQGTSFMNSNVFTNLHCNLWADMQPEYPDTFICPPPNVISWIVDSDNPNPVAQCRTNGDIATLTVQIRNNNSISNRNIRASISNTDAAYVEFVEDPNLDFNCIRVFPNSRTEFRITNTPNSLCDNEMLYLLDTNETQSVQLKIRYKGGIQTGTNSFGIQFYTGNVLGQNSLTHRIFPFIEKNGGNFSVWNQINPLIISGTVLMNNPTPYTFEKRTIPGIGIKHHQLTLFKPGASLVIESGSVVKMNHASFEGCEQMWQGVTVKEGAQLEMHSMSSIMDAQAAVNVQQGGILKASDCQFYNNNFGVRPVPGGNGNHQITLMGNKFGTTTAGLKPAYSGQSPAPFANRGFVGIDLVRNNNPMPMAFVLQKSAAGLDNHFFDLHNGILARNTDLVVSNSYFDNITYMPGAPLIFNNTSSGKAISVSGNSLTVIGEGDAAADPVNFSNCHTGIHSFNSTLSVKHNKMRSMQYGILSAVESNKTVEITQNDVQASQTGIGAYHLSTLPNGCNVTWNKVEMNGSATGIGIHTGLFGTTFQDGGNISNNDVTVATGQAGIYAGLSRNLKIFQNDVTLANASTKQGIGLNGGDRISVNCNYIEGQGENGIYSLMAGRSSFACNSTLNTGYGMKFEGTAEGKAPNFVAGNTMADNADAGLLLGADALIGPQEHRGNLWVNGGGATVAQHLGGTLLAPQSLFTVDANENAAFLPTLTFPFDWFINSPNPATSYQCLPYNTCPFPVAPSDPIRDLNVAGGGISGFAHQEPQYWTTKRRLYEKLTEEGNPYLGNATINNFLSQAQTNGIKAYGDLQIGLRQLYQLSNPDIAELQGYEFQIAQKLDTLAQKEAQLNIYGLSQQDSVNLSGQRAAILLQLSNILAQQSVKIAAIISSRAVLANALTAQNNNLTGAAGHLTNEKTVNGMLLQLAISGGSTLSAAQIFTLEAIAGQCPLTGGEAVLAARVILAWFSAGSGFYDDDVLCNSLPKPISAVQQFELEGGSKIVIFPNPANDVVNVEYVFATLENASALIQLVNIYGQVVKEGNLVGKEGVESILVNDIPSGVYFLSLNGKAAGRISINH